MTAKGERLSMCAQIPMTEKGRAGIDATKNEVAWQNFPT
jgi:hypothetical protein